MIKDYAIKYNSNEKEQIKNMNLCNCVKKIVKDEETKNLLLHAAWIANDYAHYENNHPTINIDNLKKLIELSYKRFIHLFIYFSFYYLYFSSKSIT